MLYIIMHRAIMAWLYDAIWWCCGVLSVLWLRSHAWDRWIPRMILYHRSVAKITWSVCTPAPDTHCYTHWYIYIYYIYYIPVYACKLSQPQQLELLATLCMGIEKMCSYMYLWVSLDILKTEDGKLSALFSALLILTKKNKLFSSTIVRTQLTSYASHATAVLASCFLLLIYIICI